LSSQIFLQISISSVLSKVGTNVVKSTWDGKAPGIDEEEEDDDGIGVGDGDNAISIDTGLGAMVVGETVGTPSTASTEECKAMKFQKRANIFIVIY
jgi:hypothetical protein